LAVTFANRAVTFTPDAVAKAAVEGSDEVCRTDMQPVIKARLAVAHILQSCRHILFIYTSTFRYAQYTDTIPLS
jgi:hypothetical protein